MMAEEFYIPNEIPEKVKEFNIPKEIIQDTDEFYTNSGVLKAGMSKQASKEKISFAKIKKMIYLVAASASVVTIGVTGSGVSNNQSPAGNYSEEIVEDLKNVTSTGTDDTGMSGTAMDETDMNEADMDGTDMDGTNMDGTAMGETSVNETDMDGTDIDETAH